MNKNFIYTEDIKETYENTILNKEKIYSLDVEKFVSENFIAAGSELINCKPSDFSENVCNTF